MNTDIRVATRLRNSRKRMRFESILGANSFMHIIDLWLTVAMERPSGVLTGWDEVDICLAANWKGDHAEFMRAACDPQCAFIDSADGEYVLHDWVEHQAWVCAAPDRSKAAKKAAEARWNKRLKTKGKRKDNAEGMRGACGAHAKGNAPSPNPSPNPSPSHKEKTNDTAPAGAPPTPPPDDDGPPLPPDDPPPPTGKAGLLSRTAEKQHYEKAVGNYFKTIKTAADNFESLLNSGKIKTNGTRFNIHQLIQKFVNERKHPGAIAYVIDGISKPYLWEDPKFNPWAYVVQILKTKNGTFNERDSIAISNAMKKMEPGVLRNLTFGMVGTI